MTLPRAKSRSITVDGQRYRWLVSSPEDSDQLHLRIEREDVGGQRLLYILSRWEDLEPGVQLAIRPRVVAAAIRGGLARGWTPERGGPEFRLRWLSWSE